MRFDFLPIRAVKNSSGRFGAKFRFSGVMNHTKPPTHRRGTLRAVIIYEDIAGAKRAIEILRRASSLCGASSHWEFKPWRVDMLRRPTAADEALKEAVDADVIAIADVAGEKSRPWLMNWLQDWSRCRTSRKSALVVTRTNTKAGISDVSHELSAFATQNNLDVMIESESPHPVVDAVSLELAIGHSERNSRYWGYGQDEERYPMR